MVNLVKRIAERSAYIVLVLFAVGVGNTIALAEEPASESELLVLEAHKVSKTAQSAEQLTHIIELCRDAAKKGLSPELVRYNNRLRSWAHNKRGELEHAAGNHTAAYTDFEVAVGLGPNSWRALNNRGASYVRRRQFDRALADLNNVFKLKPDFSEAYLHRAGARLGLKRYRKALDDYNVYIDSRPDDADAFAGRGYARFHVGKKKSGVADLYHALRLDPKNVAALIHRGEVFIQLGIYDKAARDFRSAIEIDPKSERAYRQAAWLMATCPTEKYRNRRLAIEAAQKAIELAGTASYEHLDTLAAAQANDGKFDEAQQTMVRAMKLASNAERTILTDRLKHYQQSEPYRLAFEPKSADTPEVAEKLEGPALR